MSNDNKEEVSEWGCVVLIAIIVLCVTAYEIAKLFLGK